MTKRLAGISMLGKKLLVGMPSTVSLAQERKMHMREMERLDREIPLPSGKTRGFVFRR